MNPFFLLLMGKTMLINYTFTQLAFAFCMVLQVLVGLFCAHCLDQSKPLWLRLLILSPSFTALFTLRQMCDDDYVAYLPDILRALSVFLLYAFAASFFTNRPWLNFTADAKT